MTTVEITRLTGFRMESTSGRKDVPWYTLQGDEVGIVFGEQGVTFIGAIAAGVAWREAEREMYRDRYRIRI